MMWEERSIMHVCFLLELLEKIPVSKRKIVFDFLSVIAEEASQK